MDFNQSKSASWGFVFGRNFGDALIGRIVIESVKNSFPDKPIRLLTRPSFVGLFSDLVRSEEILESQFPIGTRKNFGIREFACLWKQIRRMKQERMEICFNDFGDTRETFLCWLTSPRRIVAPVWPKDHPFQNMIRTPGVRHMINSPIPIPSDLLNVYGAHELMAKSLGCHQVQVKPLPSRARGRGTIGIHPFASQECRLWTWTQWRELVGNLLTRFDSVEFYGAPNEAGVLDSEIKSYFPSDGVDIVTGSLNQFLKRLGEIDLLVALDSFSIHAAFFKRTPAIMLNGANEYRMWAPPGVRVLSNGGNCSFYPCFCRPKCESESNQIYKCIRGTHVSRVLQEVDAAISGL